MSHPKVLPAASPMAQWVKNPPAMQETQETQVQSLGWEDPLEEEMATQYSCLENPMDGGAWQATVHGVAKSWTQVSPSTAHKAAETPDKNPASQFTFGSLGPLRGGVLATRHPGWNSDQNSPHIPTLQISFDQNIHFPLPGPRAGRHDLYPVLHSQSKDVHGAGREALLAAESQGPPEDLPPRNLPA